MMSGPPDHPRMTHADISVLVRDIEQQKRRLAAARAEVDESITWYLYDILGNLPHIDALLHGEHRNLGRLARGLPVADIGAADGDLAFVLEDIWGWEVDLIDTAATNQNGLQGARALKCVLGSRVRIEDIDLDSQFRLPRERYGLVFLLGILYHLQSPYYVLRQIARHSDYCILSTKVARFAGHERIAVGGLPMAYLVAPTETNNDPTNYWIFTPSGLQRLVSRTGWTVLDQISRGDTEMSDPSSPEHDERMFMLLKANV